MKRMLLLVSIVFLSQLTAYAGPQNRSEEEVMAVIQLLFDGMRAADSTAVRSVFHDTARLQVPNNRDGQPHIRTVPIDDFVAAVGSPHEEVWNEQIWDWEVRIDDNLATVWNQYAFYLGDNLDHCGVDAFQLFQGADGWRIIQVADTQRTEGCQAPSQ